MDYRDTRNVEKFGKTYRVNFKEAKAKKYILEKKNRQRE